MTRFRLIDSAAPGKAASDRRRSGDVSRWKGPRNAAVLYASVAVGTMIGGTLRALASVAIAEQTASAFPWGTLFVNITGSLVIGFYAALTGPDGRLLAGAAQRQFVMTGLCGGFTTFSIFSLETLRLIQMGDSHGVLLNIALSIVSWLSAVWLGHTLGTRLNRLTR